MRRSTMDITSSITEFWDAKPSSLVETFYCFNSTCCCHIFVFKIKEVLYEGWNFNSGNYLFTTDTK